MSRGATMSARAAAALCLCLLAGCALDPVRLRVRDPAQVSLLRETGAFRAGRQVLLPPSAEPAEVAAEYEYRPPRGSFLPAAFCAEGPAPGAAARLSAATGLAVACRGAARALRLPGGAVQLEIGGVRRRIVDGDGAVPFLLRAPRRDRRGLLAARFDPRPTERNDLPLLLQTPAANLAAAVRVQRRMPVLGGLLLGLGALWGALGGGAVALGAGASQDGATLGPALSGGLAGLSFAVSGALLGSGIYLLARPARDVPLRW